MDKLELIQTLKKIDGAISYDSDTSLQVLLPIPTEKKLLRIGLGGDNDSDLWWDYYGDYDPETKQAMPEFEKHLK